MYADALDWVRTTYPYWNASGGADHIWLFAHDEGACWAPAELYDASIILTHWGRLAPPSPQHGHVTDSLTSRCAPACAQRPLHAAAVQHALTAPPHACMRTACR